jgi:hypothetical protein
MQNVYEQFFYMKMFGNWSFTELYNLPIGLRTWFFEKLVDYKKQENEAHEEALKPSK